MHLIPTVVINGIPFHIVHQVNNLSDSSILNIENGPIYETLDGDYYSEISNSESDRVEVGSIAYQASPLYPEEGRTSEATAQCIPPRRCIPSTQDSYLHTGQRTEYHKTGVKSGEHRQAETKSEIVLQNGTKDSPVSHL